MDVFKDILDEPYPLFSDVDQLFARPIQKRNLSSEINIPQNNDDQSSSDEKSFISNQYKKRHRGGLKRDQVWDYVNIGESFGDRHYKASILWI